MQRLARWIARRVWWASLWWMRRPWIRRLQTATFRWLPSDRAERARRNLVRQNVLARRIGLRMVTFVVFAALISLTIQSVYALAVFLVDSGVLRPQSLRPQD